MADIFANRTDWLLKVTDLKGYDVLTIHPLDGLTLQMVLDAMSAQGILWKRRGQPHYRVMHHGTKILIQLEDPGAECC